MLHACRPGELLLCSFAYDISQSVLEPLYRSRRRRLRFPRPLSLASPMSGLFPCHSASAEPRGPMAPERGLMRYSAGPPMSSCTAHDALLFQVCYLCPLRRRSGADAVLRPGMCRYSMCLARLCSERAPVDGGRAYDSSGHACLQGERNRRRSLGASHDIRFLLLRIRCIRHSPSRSLPSRPSS